jgi:hypothetical protein
VKVDHVVLLSPWRRSNISASARRDAAKPIGVKKRASIIWLPTNIVEFMVNPLLNIYPEYI